MRINESLLKGMKMLLTKEERDKYQSGCAGANKGQPGINGKNLSIITPDEFERTNKNNPWSKDHPFMKILAIEQEEIIADRIENALVSGYMIGKGMEDTDDNYKKALKELNLMLIDVNKRLGRNRDE